MPGSSELEENKIFKDIALGTAGKDGVNRTSSYKKYRECPLWDNLKKKKEAQLNVTKMAEDTIKRYPGVLDTLAEGVKNEIEEDLLSDMIKRCDTVNK